MICIFYEVKYFKGLTLSLFSKAPQFGMILYVNFGLPPYSQRTSTYVHEEEKQSANELCQPVSLRVPTP